jgi:membrane protein DedA with SNARE-associated domain
LFALLDPTSLVASSGYLAIFLLSVLQSCCIPTSSELVLGFGGVLASQGKLSLGGVIAAGVAGEVVGAYIAYFIGRTGGRSLVDRYGRYVLLSNRDLDRAEAWYQRHGRWGVFGSRLVPVIRNFVAVPAGVAEVPLVRFGVMTFLGSLIWDGAWALIGYQLGSSWKSIVHGFNDAGYLLFALAVIAVVLFFVHRWRSYKGATALDSSNSAPAAQGGHFAGGTAADEPVTGPPAVSTSRLSSPGASSRNDPVTPPTGVPPAQLEAVGPLEAVEGQARGD